MKSALSVLGSCDGAVREALDALRTLGVAVDYLRVRAFPFGEEVERFLAAHQQLFIVEQNRDAQLRALLTLETAVEKSKCIRCCTTTGCPFHPPSSWRGILAQLSPQTRQQPKESALSSRGSA